VEQTVVVQGMTVVIVFLGMITVLLILILAVLVTRRR
jgi:hypothetical protein